MWIENSAEDKEDYAKAKKAVKSKLPPTTFTVLEKCNGRSMLPSEALPLFLTSNDYWIRPCRGYQMKLENSCCCVNSSLDYLPP